MNRKKTQIGAITLVLLGMMVISSCRQSLGPSDYARSMTSIEKGPIQVKESKGFTFELQYRFPKYEALISLSNSTVSSDSISERVKWFNTDHKFKLRLYPTDKKESVLKSGTLGQAQYFERIQYFSSAVKEDFAIITESKDTIYATHAALERSYGMTPYIDLIVSFTKEKNQKLKELLFLDRALSKEKIEFDISAITQEKNYPKLKI